jgi:hypothetical protein
MSEDDPLDDLLREWKSPEPTDELDRRITSGYRTMVRPPIWRRFWRTRISIPAPALVSAALVVLALFLWLHPHSGVSVTTPSAPGPAAVQPETRVTLADFQPVQQLEPHVMKEGQ